jgi:predicted O-methyltransferase YrrM
MVEKSMMQIPTPDQLRFREMEDALPRITPAELDPGVQLLNGFPPTSVPKIRLNQRLSEWKRFMQFLAGRGFPQTILEIGTGRGGSAFFWSRLSPAGSRIVTVDLSQKAAEAVAVYDRPGANSVFSVVGDSRSIVTVEAVDAALDGREVDLLYIDGDHTYYGVKSDFETYEPFCAERGLVAFHDIHLDFLHAKGIQTPCDSGEVYKFWEEVKAGRKSHEFVEEPRAEMDGFGIGVIER